MTDEIPAKPETAEIAVARDSDENIGTWASGLREANDPILRGRGGDLKFYDHVRSDAQVWATMQQRRDAVVARDWEVRPGDEDNGASVAAAERLKEELTALDWDSKTRRMHWGIFYGYGVAECMWDTSAGQVAFADLRVRRARRFGFDVDGKLMLRPVIGRSETLMPDAKFWVLTSGVDTDDEPYGLGLAHLCYWPCYFKRAGIKSWMIALDKYASPTSYGKFPAGTTIDDQTKLLKGLRAIKQDSALVVPDGMDIGYLQATKSGAIEFDAFDRRMDAWISKIILSQTMTTDDGSSRSQSETHMDVRNEVTASDADLICGSFNRGPARWWTHWNFGEGVEPPQVVRIMEDEEDLDQASERDERLTKMGYRPSPEKVTDTYGPGYEPVSQATDGGTSEIPPELSEEAEPDAITRFVDDLVSAGTAPEAAADMLAPIVEALDNAETFEAATAALDGLSLSGQQLEPLRDLLTQAAFATRVGGEVGAGLRDGIEMETL